MGKVFRRASTAAIQLIGNALKLVFHADFALRPGKRYTIPAMSPPRWRPAGAKKIPRIVWQTNKTGEVALSLYVNHLFNRLMTPTFEHRFCDDAACDQFVPENYTGDIYARYSRLQIGAAKACVWRVLVLLKEGGVYLDMDAALSWPPESFLSADQTELFIRDVDGRLTNYFLASAPGNAVFAAIRDCIVENIKANTIASVFDMTGPTVVDDIAGAAVYLAGATSVTAEIIVVDSGMLAVGPR